LLIYLLGVAFVSAVSVAGNKLNTSETEAWREILF